MNYHAILAHFPKINYNRYQKLIGYFPNLADLWQAEFGELAKAGLDENIANEFLLWREAVSAEKITERLDKEGIRPISLPDKDYPRLLREIADPPHTIFVRGRLPPEETACLAIVGTRQHTVYGKLIAEKLAGELARLGVAIISGLALGIDGVAHTAALDAQGLTVAVLGSGLDSQHVYPAPHRRLAERIVSAGGAVISEYPPDFLAALYTFPARNRIIAGLSLGTLVIEAPESSGALITARCALDYNREVLAIPHPITSLKGVGCNNLIKMGAKLVSTAEDVLEALNLQSILQTSPRQAALPLDPAEAKIMQALANEARQIDAIIKETALDSSVVNSTLTLMEIKGLVKNVGGMTYIKS